MAHSDKHTVSVFSHNVFTTVIAQVYINDITWFTQYCTLFKYDLNNNLLVLNRSG